MNKNLYYQAWLYFKAAIGALMKALWRSFLTLCKKTVKEMLRLLAWISQHKLLSALILSVTLNVGMMVWAIVATEHAAQSEYQSFIDSQKVDSIQLKSFKYFKYHAN